MLNGFGVNGAYTPAWIVRAAVAAVAAATISPVAPTRLVFASAYGDANVVVTLNQVHQVAAYVSAAAGSSSALQARQQHAATVNVPATATGNAAVLRNVPAEAGGDASATGLAIANAKLGDATASCVSSVVLCNAHIVHPGAANQPVTASAVAPASNVTRYSPVLATAGVVYARAEASTKLNSDAFFRLDGFVLSANCTATAVVAQNLLTLTVTNSFGAVTQCTPIASAFRYQPANSLQYGYSIATAVSALKGYDAEVLATAGATASLQAVRVAGTTVLAIAAASSVAPGSLQKHAGHVSAQSVGTAAQITPLRNAVALSTGSASASASVGAYGEQFFSTVNANAAATAEPVLTTALASAFAAASAAGAAIYGQQNFGEVLANSAAGAVLADGQVKLRFATATNNALSEGAGFFADQRYATVFAVLQAIAEPADGQVKLYYGRAVADSTAFLASAQLGTQHYALAYAQALAGATGIPIGTQHYAQIAATAQATNELADGKITVFGAQSSANATAFLASVQLGTQHYAIAQTQAVAGASGVPFATQHYANAIGFALLTAVSVRVVIDANATGLATAIAIPAAPNTLSNTPATAERVLNLFAEDRGLLIPSENRTMVVPS